MTFWPFWQKNVHYVEFIYVGHLFFCNELNSKPRCFDLGSKGLNASEKFRGGV